MYTKLGFVCLAKREVHQNVYPLQSKYYLEVNLKNLK
jgi:hypothetical protein